MPPRRARRTDGDVSCFAMRQGQCCYLRRTTHRAVSDAGPSSWLCFHGCMQPARACGTTEAHVYMYERSGIRADRPDWAVSTAGLPQPILIFPSSTFRALQQACRHVLTLGSEMSWRAQEATGLPQLILVAASGTANATGRLQCPEGSKRAFATQLTRSIRITVKAVLKSTRLANTKWLWNWLRLIIVGAFRIIIYPFQRTILVG